MSSSSCLRHQSPLLFLRHILLLRQHTQRRISSHHRPTLRAWLVLHGTNLRSFSDRVLCDTSGNAQASVVSPRLTLLPGPLRHQSRTPKQVGAAAHRQSLHDAALWWVEDGAAETRVAVRIRMVRDGHHPMLIRIAVEMAPVARHHCSTSLLEATSQPSSERRSQSFVLAQQD